MSMCRRLGMRKHRIFENLESRQMLSGSSFEVPRATTPATEFFRLSPLGSLAFASIDNAGTISDAECEEVDFTFSGKAGETVSAVVTPTDAGAIVTVNYLGVGGVALATATATEVGASVVLPTTRLATSGQGTFRITSNLPTDFTINIYRNVVLESSVGDSAASDKVDISPSQIEEADRLIALGSTALDPSQTTIFNEAFEGSTSFDTNDLWHVSAGRASDGQPGHSGRGLYFGQAELASTQTGTLNWDAELDNSRNRIWESTSNNQTDTRWTFGSTTNPGTGGSASNLAGVKEWYTLNSTATMQSLEDSRGDEATEQDASFELVFRPRNFNGTHVLFETGGNADGTAILLDNESLEVRVQNSDDDDRRIVRNFAFGDSDLNKFHHVVLTIHPDGTAAANQIRLFVNGSEVGGPATTSSVLADWGGTDDSGLGRASGGFAYSNDTTLTGDFDGDIALLRYHEGRLLGIGEVTSSYGNLVNDFDFVVGNYNTGARVGGDAISPTITLAVGSDYTLSFDTLIQVEDAEQPFELMQVLVRNASTAAEEVLLDRFDGTLPVDTLGEWTNIDIDLASFAGQNVQVIFRFDSGDGNNNSLEGWWIDNVRVHRVGAVSTDDDQYTVDLSDQVGNTVDVILDGQADADYSGQTLELWSPSGARVASGASRPVSSGHNAANYDLGILGYEVATPGVYTVRVVSDADTAGEQYGIVVLPNAAIETEPNSQSSSLRTFQGGSLLGYLRSGGSQIYSTRSAFELDNPGLTVEDFESGIVPSTDVVAFAGPLNSQTANTAFPSGITSGVSISATGNGQLALTGADFLDEDQPGSKAVGPDSFSSSTNLTFTNPVTAVGFDMFGDGDVRLRLYDASDVPIRTSIVRVDPLGTFFGATTTQPISRVELIEIIRSGELIDNLTFGTAGVIPSSDTDSFVISLSANESVQLTTSTPFDDRIDSPKNTLDPRLEIVGPGVTLTDDDSLDGKNARLAFTASVAGDYEIRVHAEVGQGEYVVNIGSAPLVGYIDADRRIVLEANEVDVLGLNFSSEAGLLVPIPNGDADPFTFALSNTSNQIALGSLGSTIRLDGQLVTQIRYNGDDPASDLTASFGFGDGSETVFPVELRGATADPLDCNGDGTTDAADLHCTCGTAAIDEVLGALGLTPGDLDADGRVTFADFLRLSASFGQSDVRYTDGDVNCSGRVDFADFLVIAANFG